MCGGLSEVHMVNNVANRSRHQWVGRPTGSAVEILSARYEGLHQMTFRLVRETLALDMHTIVHPFPPFHIGVCATCGYLARHSSIPKFTYRLRRAVAPER